MRFVAIEVQDHVLASGNGLRLEPYVDARRAVCVPDEASVAGLEPRLLAHHAGLQVVAWTINEPEQMRRLIAAGADGIITDYPDRLLTVLRD